MSDSTFPIDSGRPTTPLPADQAAALRELTGAPLPSPPTVASATVATAAGVATATAVKPGWQTSEFWLSTAAKLLGVLFASGVIGTGTVAERIAGLAAALLAQLGYTVSRGAVKAAAGALIVVMLGSAVLGQVACVSRAQVASGAAAGLNCEAPNIKALVVDVIPLAIAEIEKWISGSGSVDKAGLKADLAAITGDLPKCALDAAVAILTAPPAPAKPGAPISAAMAVDRAGLRAAYAEVRGELGWR
jgi:acid phosphatase family membrane protein YuiD